MPSVTLANIRLAFGDRDILKGIDLTLDTNSRAALTGANGSGKTTLMKIMAGLASPDSGDVFLEKETRISYLPQSGISHRGAALYEEAEKAFAYLKPLLDRKNALEERLARADEGDPKAQALIEKHHTVQEQILSSGYYSRNAEIGKVLTGLGFSREQFHEPASTFSSGWQMRIALSKILLEKPDIMLLDEPTNYLDIEARTWMEEYLDGFHGGFCIVSHDRYFLDTTVNSIIELFHGNIHLYRGTYSEYETRRRKEMETLLDQYERQQEDIKKTEEFIQRFRYNASKAKMVQSRIKYLEKLDRIEIPENLKKMRISFPAPPRSGHLPVEASSIDKWYGPEHVLKEVSFALEKGEKLAVTGINGAGKSTLLRILAGRDTAYSGEVRYGKGVKIGFFCEEYVNNLTSREKLIDFLEAASPTEQIPLLRDLLGAFLFRGDDVYKQVAVLSGGEKSRLVLLTLMLRPVNLLILDEPTNHLDIHSKDILLDALGSYGGTVVFVSHDRHFLDNLATKVLELDDGVPTLYFGDFSYYLWKREHTQKEAEGPQFRSGPSEVREEQEKEEYERAKQIKNRMLKLERTEEAVLRKIEEAESQLAEFREKLNLPEAYADPKKAAELQQCIQNKEREIEKFTEEWELLEAEKRNIEKTSRN